MKLTSQIERMIIPLARRVSSMIVCGIVKSLDDKTKLQAITVSMNREEISECIRLQEFGFTSSPPVGSEIVVVFPGGDRSNGIVISSDSSKHRPSGLNSGDVSVYDSHGNVIKLSNGKVEILSDNIELAGGLKKMITEDILLALNTHVHQVTSIGAPSGPALSPGPNPFSVVLHATSKVKGS